MSNWQKVRLGDVCSLSTGFPFKGDQYARDGVPVVRGDNVTIGSLRWDDKKCWNLPFDRFNEYSLKSNDIVIGMDGSRVGRNRTQIKTADLPLLLAQRVACVRNNDFSIQQFLYYQIFSNRFEQYIKAVHTGTSIPHISLKQLGDFEFLLPPLVEQERIAGILGALDDKIELNNRINRNLEEQAAALFRRWFVDFEFPNENGNPYRSSGGTFIDSPLGEIPTDWQIGRLDELITVKYGKDHKKLGDGVIPVYGSGGIMRYANSALYTKETVLIPRKGTLNNVFIVDHPFWSVDTMFYTEMNKPNIAKFVYLFLKTKDLASMNAGSAVPSMTTDILNQIPVILASNEMYIQFDKITTSLFDAINRNTKENRTLATLRDTLLPKLMNNEI